ncbi:MAG: 50S ribosomal protein L3 [Candidatus Pelagibacter sp.]|nr:50S ribosomal protein L3 [Candidatus Pelagibacter sp.]OUV98402.1 MAG: 50S ribosomal protein L3 [Candidatus Pelagibacter sp. TMED142]
MSIGLIGKKMGMSQRFFENGEAVPVTILKIEKAKVIEVIKKEKRGYAGILVGYGFIKSSKLTKQMKGFFSKKSQEPKKILKEFKISNENDFKPGSEINLSILKDKKFVDVRSRTIGKGFAGSMKRHNFSGLRASHGVSISHRSHGSTGQNQDPGKVFKGKKMAGHMGDKLRTTLGLEIVDSDLTNNLLYLRGSVPGSKNTYVEIREAVKKKSKETVNDRVKKYLTSIEDMKSSKKEKKEAKSGPDKSKEKEQKNQIKQNPSDKNNQGKPK